MSGSQHVDPLPNVTVQPGSHIDEIKAAARKTGDAARDWMGGSSPEQHVSPAMRQVKNARENMETSVQALKETETPVKQRGGANSSKNRYQRL